MSTYTHLRGYYWGVDDLTHHWRWHLGALARSESGALARLENGIGLHPMALHVPIAIVGVRDDADDELLYCRNVSPDMLLRLPK